MTEDKSIGDEGLELPSIGELTTKFTDQDCEKTGDSRDRNRVDTSSLSDGSTWTGGSPSIPEIELTLDVVDLAARYEFIRLLGRGGMGEVHLALDRRLGRQVAIKRIRLDSSDLTGAQARFQTEAKAIAAVNHPAIVEIYDFGRDNFGPFLIMEYMSGGSLAERLKTTISPEAAVRLTQTLCDGLGMAHKAGLIHRDIKPSNVLLTSDGRPKLTDFGLAKQQSEDRGMTVSGMMLGTVDYMSPEQRIDAARVDARSDLWSLAATLYQMLSGTSPRQIRFQKVPKTFQPILEKALEDDPELRYATVAEFREALSDALLVSKAPAQNVEELDRGQCSNCHTINDSTRKFCKACGSSLRTNCLSCQNELPLWERFCGECGSDQRRMLATLQEKYVQSRHIAQECRARLEYAKAVEISEELKLLSDARFQEFSSWARQFVEEVQQEAEQQRQHIEQCQAEAKQHRSSYDYDAAIRSLERVPESLRSEELKKFQEQLNIDRDKAKSLMIEIRRRIKEKNLDGLRVFVHEAQELLGTRPDLEQLDKQLTSLELRRSVRLANSEASKLKRLHELSSKRHKEYLISVANDRFDEWQNLAAANIPAAFVLLGNCYQIGIRFGRDVPAAIANYTRAASGGDLAGNYFLGIAYRESKDITRAADCFRIAADQGDPMCQALLGDCYLYSPGVETDVNRGIELVNQAVQGGSSYGYYLLGVAHLSGTGVAQNDVEAVKCFNAAVRQGCTKGMVMLGEMYRDGRGVKQNLQKAVELIRLSAEQGDHVGQCSLGGLYFNGLGVPKSYVNATEWIRKSADQGNAIGQFWLGMMYHNGLGVAKDDNEAVNWFRQSAEQGVVQSQAWLNSMNRERRGLDPVTSKAAHGLPEATEAGKANPETSFNFPAKFSTNPETESVEPSTGVVSSSVLHNEAWPNLRLIADRQRVLIWTLLAGVCLELPLASVAAVYPNVSMLLYLIFGAFAVFANMRLALVVYQVKERMFFVLLTLFSIIPLFGLIMLFVINRKATSVLTSGGIKVGFMGVDPRWTTVQPDCTEHKGEVLECPEYTLHPLRGIVWAAFWGTPLAAGIVMGINYLRMGNRSAAGISVVAGVLATAAYLTTLFMIPEAVLDRIPGLVFVAVQLIGVYLVARTLQSELIKIHATKGGSVASAWPSVGIGILCLIVVIVTLFVVTILFAIIIKASNESVVRIGNAEVYYSGNATEEDARRVEDVLREAGYFGDESRVSVLLESSSGQYTISFVVKDGVWDNPEFVKAFEDLGRSLEQRTNYKPLKILLCDATLSPKRLITIE